MGLADHLDWRNYPGDAFARMTARDRVLDGSQVQDGGPIARFGCAYDRLTPTIFHEPWWLDAATGGNFDFVEVSSGGRVTGRLPFSLTTHFGVRTIRMPDLTYFLGPGIDEGEGSPNTRFLKRLEITRELLRRLPSASWQYIKCHRGIDDAVAFQESGFRTYVQFTHEVLPDDEEVLWRNMRNKTRNVIRRAEELTVTEMTDPSEFIRLYDRNLELNGRRNALRSARWNKLISACLVRGCGRILAAHKNNQVMAANFCVWDKRSAFYLLSTRRHDSGNGAASLLVWEAIKDSARRGLIFDLAGVGDRGSVLLYSGSEPHFDSVHRGACSNRCENLPGSARLFCRGELLLLIALVGLVSFLQETTESGIRECSVPKDVTNSIYPLKWVHKNFLLRFNIGPLRFGRVRLKTKELWTPFPAFLSHQELPPVRRQDLDGVDAVAIAGFPVSRKVPIFQFPQGLIQYMTWSDTRYLIAISGSFDAYLQSRSAKVRRKLRQRFRSWRALPGGDVPLREFCGPAEIDEFYSIAIPVSHKTWQSKLGAELESLDPREESLRMAEGDLVRGYVLFCGEKAAAFLICHVKGNTLVESQTGYDPAYARYSPGFLVHYLLIEKLFAEGEMKFLDLMEGTLFPYKAGFTTLKVPSMRFMYFRRKPKEFCFVLLVYLHSKLEKAASLAKRLVLRSLGRMKESFLPTEPSVAGSEQRERPEPVLDASARMRRRGRRGSVQNQPSEPPIWLAAHSTDKFYCGDGRRSRGCANARGPKRKFP